LGLWREIHGRRQPPATSGKRGAKGQIKLDADVALEILLEKLDVVRAMFHGFDNRRFEKEAICLLVPATGWEEKAETDRSRGRRSARGALLAGAENSGRRSSTGPTGEASSERQKQILGIRRRSEASAFAKAAAADRMVGQEQKVGILIRGS
jgi:hypothetical protein